MTTLNQCDCPSQRPAIPGSDTGQKSRRRTLERMIGPVHHILDHAIQPKALAVLWGIHSADAVFLEQRDLLRQDDSASAREDTDVRGIPFTQPVDHVLEELDVPSLVGRDRNCVRVLVQGCSYDLINASIVAEMDHLATVSDKQPANNIDACVMSVEQTGGRYEAQLSGSGRGSSYGRFD